MSDMIWSIYFEPSKTFKQSLKTASEVWISN